MDEANNIGDNRIRSTDKDEHPDILETTSTQTLDKLNAVEDSKQSAIINQYEEDIRCLRRYLTTQMKNNDSLQQELKSLTEKSEAEVRQLKDEAKLAAVQYDKLLENFRKYENQIDLNNRSIADLNAKLSNQLFENRVIGSKMEMVCEEMRRNEKEVKNERDEAIRKLLVSTERLAAEKRESLRCKQDLDDLKKQVELQKKTIAKYQIIFVVIFLSVTAVGLIGWILFLSNNYQNY